MVSESLPTLVAPDRYVKERPAFFPSISAFEHYKRSNKALLVKAGALVMHRGAWLVDPRVFDEQVMAIAKAKARDLIARQRAAAEAAE